LGVAQAIAMVQAKLGTVTPLVNNAGVGGPIGPTWEVSATEWWRTMEVNLRGARGTTRHGDASQRTRTL
jgi:NAD(P)-dependent dehydrogenase (short-subunit alcohol dehydrogenase family)